MPKQCTKCKQVKSIESFYRRNNRKPGSTRPECIDCNKASKARPPKPKRTKTDIHLQCKYGISEVDYLKICEQAEYKCQICKQDKIPTSDKTTHKDRKQVLMVDHCHDTGIVRGVLCHKCNTGLGLFEDNIISLQNATDYLKV